jgi:hypothetical protein
MDAWDIALLVVVGYVAVVVLVRMMAAYRDTLVTRLRDEMARTQKARQGEPASAQAAAQASTNTPPEITKRAA